jgi:hypothetical protein
MAYEIGLQAGGPMADVVGPHLGASSLPSARHLPHTCSSRTRAIGTIGHVVWVKLLLAMGALRSAYHQ